MRTPKLLLAPLALALAALPAFGRADTKIGVIDIVRAMDEIEDAKSVAAILKKETEDRQSKLDVKRTDFEKAQAEFTKQASVLADAAKKEKQDDLQKKFVELQQLADTMGREMEAKRDDLLAPIQNKMNQVVKEVADAEGLQLVVRTEAVFFHAPSLDITNEVVRRYNTRFPKKGAAAAAGDAKAAKPAGGDKPAAKPK